MSNLPDFAKQAMEIARQIDAQSAATAANWDDVVKKRYYADYIEAYSHKIDIYVHGGNEIVGKGIDDLLVFLDDNIKKMEQLTGFSQ